MATGDLYQLTDVQVYLDQQVLNVYYYKQLSAPGVGLSINALVLAWEDSVSSLIAPMQSNLLSHVGVRVINLDNPDEFILSPNALEGSQAGDGMPPYVTYAFRLNRTSRLVRNGQKRIGGVPESAVVDGVITAGQLTNAILLADAMAAIISEPISTATFEPRIVHLATEAGPGGVPAATPRADYGISSGQYVSISTQNSRKFGRGA